MFSPGFYEGVGGTREMALKLATEIEICFLVGHFHLKHTEIDIK